MAWKESGTSKRLACSETELTVVDLVDEYLREDSPAGWTECQYWVTWVIPEFGGWMPATIDRN
jgi:hypothetical protein